MDIFRCPVCGHLHKGIPDFHFCPVCSTSVEEFLLDSSSERFGHWDAKTRMQIADMADSGHYSLSGKGTTRQFTNLDDLVFLPGMVDRPPLLESEDVRCEVILGKMAARPVSLKIPILNAAMSFGALSKEAKIALARGSSLAGGMANTGEGGMLEEERELADRITLQYASGHFGISEEQLQLADMVEIKIAQGAKPGMGGKLPGAKVIGDIARVRQLPKGITAQSPARHLDISTPAELSYKIGWLRELTGGVPISLKIVGGRIEADLRAIFSQEHVPDVLVIDGAEGGTGAAPTFIKDHVGLPLAYALPRVADWLADNGLRNRVTLIAAGGIRHAADAGKCIALGAEAVYMAGALKIALGCRYIRMCHKGTCPYGIATQDPILRQRLNPVEKGKKVANFITAATQEVQTLARICGKDDVHSLDRTDLASLDPKLAAMTGVTMP